MHFIQSGPTRRTRYNKYGSKRAKTPVGKALAMLPAHKRAQIKAQQGGK